MTIDCDISKLSPADLKLVQRFVEDRFLNAIQPLSVYLDSWAREPERTGIDKVVTSAEYVTQRVLQIVNEVRTLARSVP